MKINYPKIIIIVSAFIMGCAGKKAMISIDDLSTEKILIIGVIEYDYTQLKNTITTDIKILIESQEDASNFRLSEEYLPDEKSKKHHYISIIGDTGVYDLCLHRIRTSGSGTDDFLNQMDKDRNLISLEENTLKRLLLYDGKIINLGKITVKFKSENVEESNISYSYTVHSVNNDTIAIHALKETYPLIFDRYQNDIYVLPDKINK